MKHLSLQRKLRCIGAVCASLLSIPASAGALAAKKDGVPVTSSPAKGSAVIQTLKAGQTIESVARKGMYWSVKAEGGKTGYVSVLSVKVKAADSAGGLAGAIQDAVQSGRSTSEGANARARATVMGVRGLDETKDTDYAANARPNLKAVFSMEDSHVQPAKIEDLSEQVFDEIAQRVKTK